MKLNPHGDITIYETMVRLTEGNGSLLHPFVDSKGKFRQTVFKGYGLCRTEIYGS